MWRWDQGHIGYFEFETVRRIAKFVVNNDFRSASRTQLIAATGRDFKAPVGYSPWRNYARALKVCLLVSEAGAVAMPTAAAHVLATDNVTSDEYLHFLVRATTEPGPAFDNYDASAEFRFPLLFGLKYLLALVASETSRSVAIDQIISAFYHSGFTGEEDDSAFIYLVSQEFPEGFDDVRQERESLRVMSQISYLHSDRSTIYVSLDPDDARNIFAELDPISGPFAVQGAQEIQRRAALFQGGSDMDSLAYTGTVLSEAAEAGFIEGSKLKKTHIVIERNRQIRATFFKSNPTAICDLCKMNTHKTYPWAERVLDLHHLLPLASGRRTDNKSGTILSDLVPVCPTCHRSVHRFYDGWLKSNLRKDFENSSEARAVYQEIKSAWKGHVSV